MSQVFSFFRRKEYQKPIAVQGAPHTYQATKTSLGHPYKRAPNHILPQYTPDYVISQSLCAGYNQTIILFTNGKTCYS